MLQRYTVNMSQSTANHRPRWQQFSLKTLLIVMIFAAGYFAGIGTTIRRAQELRKAAIMAEKAAREEAKRAQIQAEQARMRAEAARKDLDELDAGKTSLQPSDRSQDQRAARATPDEG